MAPYRFEFLGEACTLKSSPRAFYTGYYSDLATMVLGNYAGIGKDNNLNVTVLMY